MMAYAILFFFNKILNRFFKKIYLKFSTFSHKDPPYGTKSRKLIGLLIRNFFFRKGKHDFFSKYSV